MRVAIGVEYDGSGFRGWQAQGEGVRTVQACLEEALAKVADHSIQLVCAGRTDAGVHGIGQVAHFDTHADRPMRGWVLGGNSYLPADISLRWASPVAEAFHARFSARARRYRYIILNRESRSALQRHRASWYYRSLNVHCMREAACHLLGEHDFTSFRALECQSKSPVRTVYGLDVERQGDFVILDVEANAFLHRMVRNIAGVLMTVGAGMKPPDWVGWVLKQRDRTRGGFTAPPEGLYLTCVRYPQRFNLPEMKRTQASLIMG